MVINGLITSAFSVFSLQLSSFLYLKRYCLESTIASINILYQGREAEVFLACILHVSNYKKSFVQPHSDVKLTTRIGIQWGAFNKHLQVWACLLWTASMRRVVFYKLMPIFLSWLFPIRHFQRHFWVNFKAFFHFLIFIDINVPVLWFQQISNKNAGLMYSNVWNVK